MTSITDLSLSKRDSIPLPINPFTEARTAIKIQTTTGQRSISHHDLARKIGVSKLALIRLEQGFFTAPLPTVLSYFVSNHGYSEYALEEAYEQFQYNMRLRHRLYFGPTLEFDVAATLHPFRQLRAYANDAFGANPTEVAKALCIPQATITHFECKYRTQKSIPKCIINVLPVIGYPGAQISSFISEYSDWRNRAIGRNVINLGTSS